MASSQPDTPTVRHDHGSREYHLAELAIALDPSRPQHSLPPVQERHRRVLDVGCGAGQSLVGCGLADPRDGREGWGVDVDAEAIALGREQWPQLRLAEGRGEALPCPSDYFDLVFSRVALPYMDIPRALGEFARVLRPGGDLWIAAHPLRMTVQELRRAAGARALKAALYRSYVLGNGLCFHLTGRVLPFPRDRRYESWQSVRGLRLALERAGFVDVTRQPTRTPGSIVITARRRPTG